MLGERALAQLAEAMFASNEYGEIEAAGPQFHLLRSTSHVLGRTNERLDRQTAAALQALCRGDRDRPGLWARDYAGYLSLLSTAESIRSVRFGMVYGFPQAPMTSSEAVIITPANAGLLLGGLEEWIQDVEKCAVMLAMVVDGRAVSICASVRVSVAIHCAGVETLAPFRGQRLGARATAAWAASVQAIGATPYYSTTFDNLPSQSLARYLGLALLASEFTVEGEATTEAGN